MAESESLTLLSRALDQAAEAIEGTEPADDTLPTPCASWDVAKVIDHLLKDLDQFQTIAVGGQGDWSEPAPPTGEERAAAFRHGGQALLEAWGAVPDLDTPVKRPMGELSGRFLVNQQISEFAVHTWDLMTATGQKLELDPEVAETALAWARAALKPDYRGDESAGMSFGQEVPVPDDAPPYDRLAAFFGRDPHQQLR